MNSRHRQRYRRSAGMTLIELLGVLALMGILFAIGSLYLSPMEAPLETSAELTEGFLKQIRTKSMATTTNYRIRPATDRELVVESGRPCTAANGWTAEPGLGLELPEGVIISSPTPLTWSICFNSRGVAAQNITITFAHDEFGYQEVEVLLGGSLRWL